MPRSNHGMFGKITRHRYWPMRSEADRQIRDLIRVMWPRVPSADLIRIGPENDGGYLVPDDFDGLVAAFSPGVSDEVGFDLAMAERGLEVFMADASVGGPPTGHPKFHFRKQFLGVVNDANTIRLEDWCNDSGVGTGDLLLQMDIEGAEWPVLLDCCTETLKRFRIMVLELHDMSALFSRLGFCILSAALRKVLATHHVVHIHPNNDGPIDRFRDLEIPRSLEMTLLRSDRSFEEGFATSFPHPLDADCVVRKPSIDLPAAWYAAP